MADQQAQLDLRGLQCPMPLLRTKLRMNQMQSGEQLTVLASDPGSWRDIPAWLEQGGHQLLASEQRGSDYWFHIRKGPQG